MKIMTRKEWMEENHPEMVGQQFIGGVKNCPYAFPELSYQDGECVINAHNFADSKCTMCWQQKIAVYDSEPKKSLWQRIKEAFSRV